MEVGQGPTWGCSGKEKKTGNKQPKNMYIKNTYHMYNYSRHTHILILTVY
jgi:hypothetical protein